jgi:hypothetical protein
MVRDPALEILHYLRTADYTRPAIRYVICILFIQLFYLKTTIPCIFLKPKEWKIILRIWNINTSKPILCDFTSLYVVVMFIYYRYMSILDTG